MRIALIALTALLILLSPLRADDTSEARAVIQSQVDAFRRNDAEGAYALASPLIHDLFPSAEIFIGMVRGGYAPVYRHKRFEMGEALVKSDGTVEQHVGIVDADDVAWEAVYTLEKQSDGSWKISGCMLKKIGAAV